MLIIQEEKECGLMVWLAHAVMWGSVWTWLYILSPIPTWAVWGGVETTSEPPAFEHWLCYFLIMWPWSNHLTSSCLILFLCKLGIRIVLPYRVIMRIRGVHGYKWLKISLAPGDCYVCLLNINQPIKKKKTTLGRSYFIFNSLSVLMMQSRRKFLSDAEITWKLLQSSLISPCNRKIVSQASGFARK